jgi:ABC-type phosphate transport system auxiliary subunit
VDDTARVIQRVDALDESSPDAENTLMEGYACALRLETERSRLERRFAELAQSLDERRDPRLLPELRSLKQQISHIEADLERLRAVLETVRGRLVRAGVAAGPAV